MATIANIPAQGSLAAMPIKYETINFAVIVETDENGRITKAKHSSSEKEIAALQAADYSGKEVLAFQQAVRKPTVGTLAGFEELVPDADERLAIINKGIGAKFNQKIRTTLIELDSEGNLAFQPTDAVYDATQLVQEETQRKVMSQEDKAMKVLAGLPADKLAALLASFRAAQGVE
jgi:hypothetical protein